MSKGVHESLWSKFSWSPSGIDSRIALGWRSSNSVSMNWAIDATHSAHTRAQTGIQQFCRDLVKHVSSNNWGHAVVYDRYAAKWRLPDQHEKECLDPDPWALPSQKRRLSWSSRQKIRGWMQRLMPRAGQDCCITGGLLIPEIFSVDQELAYSLVKGPKVAFFHDATPLLFPEWSPPSVVRRFPGYLEFLSGLDWVICISRQSEGDLLRFLKRADLPAPETIVLPLGAPSSVLDSQSPRVPKPISQQPPTVLMVGSIEARKNHLAVLDACEQLWTEGLAFNLRLMGLLNRATGTAAANRIRELAASGRPLHWKGPASQQEIIDAYRNADIFLYPSLYEGFGIPVMEAKAFGLPVITSNKGALQERLMEGGCLETETTPREIATSLKRLILEPPLRHRLVQEGRKQPVRSMAIVAAELRQLLEARWPSPKAL
jgi:glycosyltransferase involved in cell wall biosynthesis